MALKSPSLYFPHALRIRIATARIGLSCTYSSNRVSGSSAISSNQVGRTKDSSLQEQKCVGITYIELPLENADWEWWFFWWASMKKNQHRSFTTEIREEKHEETINDECLRVYVASAYNYVQW